MRSMRRSNQKRRLWEASGGKKIDGHSVARCRYCGGLRFLNELTIDHVIPKSKGGHNGFSNKVLACLPCNRDKADQMPSINRTPMENLANA